MTRLIQAVTLLAFPHGGQRLARRNALTAVTQDRAAARVRAEAYGALVPRSAPGLRRAASD